MLHIQDIRKQYVTGELVQTALDGVSLTLRDNEFVAILGPSGSGKTTLLNVIGGLDRYDSGDLIINGISTKKYTDRDWDSYRNHTIGFVFQSYNLIPHQTVLANVELALTISGISRSERRQRAAKALADVGLGDQLHKRPNQMSGGQMQRVAIARALVNNPDILLADEPTGALDSETSVQVMELLKEVSKDRLVVMVTHNPELAEEYANRIVRVKDGRIIGDTNPCEYLAGEEQPEHKNMGKASMSFFTALSLSFNNLRTKKGRTILTAFAGSIGIIGIALIMSLSTGFQNYIDQIQEDTLSNYPLTIQSETADMTALMSAYGSMLTSSADVGGDTVQEQQMISQMFAQVGTNDLSAFKHHLDENMDSVRNDINNLRYSYGIKPLIYSADTDELLQVNPGTLFGQITGMSMMSAYMDSDIFYEMVDNRELIEEQYEVLRGRWPKNSDELIIVLSSPNQISDYMAYTLGLKDLDDLKTMMDQVMEGKSIDELSDPMQWSYDDLMALEFRLVPQSAKYKYNEAYSVWEDMTGDQNYMKKRVQEGMALTVVGIVCPMEGVNTTALTPGVAYTSALTRRVIELAEDSEIVKNQLKVPDIDVFSGDPFGTEKEESQLDFKDMISVDGDMISSAFGMDVDVYTIERMLENYMESAYNSLDIDITPAKTDFKDSFSQLATDMLYGYIDGHANDEGKAILRLAEVEVIVDDYLATETAAAKLSALEKKYQLPADSLVQVYDPLLTAMLTAYIASNATLPDLPAVPEIPDIPEVPVPDASIPDMSIPEITLPDITLPELTIPDETKPVDTPESTAAEELTSEPTEGESIRPTETQPAEETMAPAAAAEEFAETPALTAMSRGGNIVLLSEVEETTTPTESKQEAVEQFISTVEASISAQDVETTVSAFLNQEIMNKAADAMATAMMNGQIRTMLMQKLAGFMPILMNYMGNSVHVDEEKLASAFTFNMDENELRRLMEAMSDTEEKSSYSSNLRKLGYADLEKPTGISVYFVDFAAKSNFLAFLDAYNADMEAEGKEDQIIQYTDITNIMMSSVRTIIDSVSYVLIAFVAVSLIVSSIMIGIITYISVMERTKEIGVLRAIGASKRNISQVFNAETFLIGLCSGLIGVGVTLLLNIPINQIIHHLTNNTGINAKLPVVSAVILVLLSMALTLIGGLIPSKHAAKKDPVIALRSE